MQKLNEGYMPAIVLMVICLFFTALLSITNEVTAEKREENKVKAILEGKQAIFPAAADFEAIDLPAELGEEIIEADLALDDAGKVLGVLVQSTAKGYNGQIPVIVGVNNEMTIEGISFLSNEETAGLGSKIGDEAFYSQMYGQSTDGFSFDGSRGTKINAVSGATISSKGAITAVNSALDALAALDFSGNSSGN